MARTSTRDAERVLSAYIDAYVDAVVRVRNFDLEGRQPAPYASLGEGAAGTAYALWRLGEWRRASAWLTAALSDRRRAAFHTTLSASSRGASTLFGRAGVSWVAALLKGGHSVSAYARNIERTCPRLEFASGSAGQLLGALILLRHRPHSRVERAAARHAERLERAVDRRAARKWQTRDATGFAHGWPGILYAVLEWRRFRGMTVPDRWADSLHELASLRSSGAIANPVLAASWCNGAAGATFLWAGSYNCTGDLRFLHAARRAARAALAASGRAATLCCGDIGVAYAMLAMARIDRDATWRREALALCRTAIGSASMPWPYGLFHGHGGLACLAHDCLDRAGGFPAVEA